MPSPFLWRRLTVLSLAGGAAFWLANLLISLTAVAAEYRATLGISYVPMLVEALLGGLIVALVVSYSLVRFRSPLPSINSTRRALLLSLIALVAATVVFEIPAKFLNPTDASIRLFLTALAFNVGRFLALGLVIGLLDDRRHGWIESRRQSHERK